MFKFSGNKLSIAEVWEASFSLYKQTLSKIWFFIFIMVIFINIASWYLKSLMPVQIPQQLPKLPVGGALLLFMIVAVVLLLLILFISAVVLHRMYNMVTQANYDLSNSITYVLSKYLIMVVSMLIVGCVMLVPIVIAGLLTALSQPFMVLVLLAELFIIFSLFLFMFNIPAILFDNKGCLDAIKSSAQLVWGNWWRTFLIFVVPLLLIFILDLVIMLIKNMWIYSLGNILLATFITFPFIKAVILVQFNDLKLRQDITLP